MSFSLVARFLVRLGGLFCSSIAPKPASESREIALRSTRSLSTALQSRGLIARVAKQLDLSRSHVSRVARGERTSRRVMTALLDELKRIEREAA